MIVSDIPARFPIPWAQDATGGFIRVIPESSQIGVQAGAASLTDGFPPVTFVPVGAGGTPPFGQDFNGILKQITQWSQWQAAGGPVGWDSDFSTSIGGYPKGAVVAAATFGNYWVCTVDANSTDPDSSGAGWTYYTPLNLYAADSGAVNAAVVALSPAPPSLASTVGLPFRAKMAATNTGAMTLNAGFGALSVVLTNGAALAGGEVRANGIATFVYDGSRYQLQTPAPAPASGPVFIVASGAWSRAVPDGVFTAEVTIGGGGGGGGGNSSGQSSGAGGAGAVAVLYMTGLVPGQNLSGTIGALGDGGAIGTTGADGGNTTILNNAVLQATAHGGVGGVFAATPAGGRGGLVTVGSFAGTIIGLSGSDGGDGSAGSTSYGGNGAPGWNGSGAGRGGQGGGFDATSYCAGGGGSYGVLGATGGDGGPGFVLIKWGR